MLLFENPNVDIQKSAKEALLHIFISVLPEVAEDRRLLIIFRPLRELRKKMILQLMIEVKPVKAKVMEGITGAASSLCQCPATTRRITWFLKDRAGEEDGDILSNEEVSYQGVSLGIRLDTK